MDLPKNPDLLDRVAASYALGTLRGRARRRFEAIARQSPTARAAALLWQERFAAFTELQLMQVPGPNVWKRIQNLLDRPPGAPAKESWWRSLQLWRGTGILGSVVAIAVMVVVVNLNREIARLQAQPEVRYVAVLADDKAGASMLVLFDPKHSTLTLKRVGVFQEGPDKSLQLWALPPGSAPRSLGVLGPQPVVKLAAAENQLQATPALAISLEPKGGVPSETGPTGPVLFKGVVLQAPL